MITTIAMILTIIGAINWLLVGAFGFNLVTFIFGIGAITTVIYIAVGIAGLWLIYHLIRNNFNIEVRENIRKY